MMNKRFIIMFLIISILLPLTSVSVLASNPGNIYAVQTGDSLEAIADKYDTTVEELKTTNGLQSNQLFVGQKLRVPIMYEVSAGDTLESLAKYFHTTVHAIKFTNTLSSDSLYVGQILKIPPKRLNMQGQHILMSREDFKDWLLNHKFSRNIRLIQQHHTWAPSYKHFSGTNHFALLKGMENYHRQEKGWSNIAQNITTFPDGTVAVSRPFDIAPEGTIGHYANSVGIAIEHIGNFDKGFDAMTAAQKETIVYITALLCIKFGLTPSVDSITYHHWWDLRTGERVLDKGPEYNVKTCPGTGFFGGNTTTSAVNNFYPFVSNKMQELKATIN